MRLISLVGVLAAALLLGACQVRNTARCQLPDYPCDKDKKEVCRIDDPATMTGSCQAECQKGVPASCSQDKPVCGDDGTCRACSADSECQAYNPALGRCVQTKCVACKTATASADCTDPNKPACDAPTGTCRACALHSECADGICVKDETLKGLPKPLLLGQCVPAARQVVVSQTTCPAGSCTLNDRVKDVSSEKPYLRLSNFKSTTVMVNISKPLDPLLPTLHIVTDTADLTPAQVTTEPSISVENNTGFASAIQVGANADVVIEGLPILRSYNGLVCGVASGMNYGQPIKVRLIRSIFSLNNNAVLAYKGCDLSVSESWFGPHPAFANTGGNSKALDLDSTRFEISNTVFLKNAQPGQFSGILLKNSGSTSIGRIINSTFVRHDIPDPTSKALAIDCLYSPGANLTILNSLFLNDTPPTGGNVYVGAQCSMGMNGGMHIAYNGADSTIPGTMNVGNLAIADVLTDVANSNLRIKTSAAASVRKGVATYTDAQGPVSVPTRDQDGRTRSSTNVTYGAFEAAP